MQKYLYEGKKKTYNEMRFIVMLWKHNGFIKSRIENFHELFELISESSRKILEIRWGLPDLKYFKGYSFLAKKLGTDCKHAKELYQQALSELYESQFAILVCHAKTIGLQKAAGFGRLGYSVSNDIQPYDIDAKALSLAVDSLTEEESKILRLYFGLDSCTPLSLEEIGNLLNLEKEEVSSIKDKSLIKLSFPSSLNTFLISKQNIV